MAESRYRSGRRKGFIVLMRDVAQDERLSLETRGLFAMMVSLPENWEYSVSGLAGKAGCGKDKIRRLLKELESVGYLIREQSHANGGKFGENIYILQDEAPPLSGNTVNGENRQRLEPMTVFPTQKNIDLRENNIPPIVPQEGDVLRCEKRRQSKPKTAPDWKPERFEGFWKAYPCGKAKQAAIKAWDKLRPDDALLEQMAKGLKKAMASRQWQEGVGIPYASTWLNQRRWEDEDDKGLSQNTPVPVQPRKFHMEMIDGEEVVVYDP